MNSLKTFLLIGLYSVFCLTINACTAEVGSEQWCTDMKKKSKADWSANTVSEFTKHCIFK